MLAKNHKDMYKIMLVSFFGTRCTAWSYVMSTRNTGIFHTICTAPISYNSHRINSYTENRKCSNETVKV